MVETRERFIELLAELRRWVRAVSGVIEYAGRRWLPSSIYSIRIALNNRIHGRSFVGTGIGIAMLFTSFPVWVKHLVKENP